MYSLKRIDPPQGLWDQANDSGSMCVNMIPTEDGLKWIETPANSPKVGHCLKVGSPYARTMQQQDYWRTSTVDKILSEEENDERVKITFKTLNSTYALRRFKS